MRARLLLLASLSLVAALAACGDDDGDEGRGTDTGSSGSGLASVELTEDLGCGYGFAVSDASERTLLSVHRNAEPGQIDRTVSLPHPDWDAELTVGTHLAANWCNDVIEEPQAQVEETWELVEGTLELVGAVPPIGDEPADQPVRAELTGVVVRSEDGERVELGDLSLSNGSWGFFAG